MNRIKLNKLNPILSTCEVEVGEHYVILYEEDYGPVTHIWAEAEDPTADIPVGDFLRALPAVWGTCNKPALLAISGATFLIWREGDRLRIKRSHSPLEQ